MFKALFLVFLSFQTHGFTISQEAAVSARNYPFGSSLDYSVTAEQLLGDPSNPFLFNLVQVQAHVAVYGLLEGKVSIYPFSFLEIGYIYSLTNRFFRSKIIDCDQYYCTGDLMREKYFARLAMAYKDVIAAVGYTEFRLDFSQKSAPVFDEIENMLANPSGERGQTTLGFLGYKQTNQIIGGLLRTTRFRSSHSENQAVYLIYKNQTDLILWSAPCGYTIGLGSYSSDYVDRGVSVFANLEWHWGQSLALF